MESSPTSPVHVLQGDLVRVSSVCACLHTRMAAREVTRAFDRALKPLGLETTQFTLLSAILANPSRSVTELADRLALERSSLSRNLALLVRRDLLARMAGRGRAVAYQATPAGEALIGQALPLWQGVQSRVESSIGKEAWMETQANLKRLRHGLRERAEIPPAD
jgi:DNA-binding MarR family transcriptional regulator